MRIYLAGPEVFLADSAAIAAAKQDICAAHGLLGVFPTDTPTPAADNAPEWVRLYQGLEAEMRGCDAIIANLTPFRGPSADPGTVFELGFMRGLGRPAFGYTNMAARFGARTMAALGPAARRRGASGWEDAEGMLIEAFDLHDNLMLEGGLQAAGGFLAVTEVPAERRWRDLTGFLRCVEAVARLKR
ncbi:nucleoside 2-deoxyribosyltransferase [Siccirubricoccus sp. KC 17139]|uniref:Nucleoside 2-deoxyribosyltransferase n=1 Tax=Siccirubricoccus soli TaxID=2899147 RepID=A0ABT1D0W8_9PROT|nr:nucleoside 2-deoxyribosyltransferase [Siccirubricoccus soli]MCO6415553.1 nucleoside 2-deoxyribosyltransferase [Siccirubricoccus soli]MCP2681685.1 nucleoside 2-deoxyribosyltransferase [Siccirubricoccus soli]